jgi:hypothetical protein
MGKQPMQKSPHHRPARAGKMTVTRCGTAVAPSPFTRKVGLDRIQATSGVDGKALADPKLVSASGGAKGKSMPA